MTQEFRQPSTDKRPLVFDWTAWLAAQNNDSILSSAMSYTALNSSDTALIITSPAASNTSTTATVWVSSGTTGQIYYIYNTITTVAGRVRTKLLKLTIANETP